MGSSSVTGDETILFTDNMSFDGTQRGGKMTTNGQLWIGSTSGRHVKLGSITSTDGSLTIGYNSPNIVLQVAGGSTTIKTVTGNTGGAISPSSGNFNFLTTNSTVKFSGTTATETLDFGLDNLFIGNSATAITFGQDNTCYGKNAGIDLTLGGSNVLIGKNAGSSLTEGGSNVLIGTACGSAMVESVSNVGVGRGALASFTGLGDGFYGRNCAFGESALTNLTTGTYNIAIGDTAGGTYAGSESSNIVIGISGTASDSNTIRIGTPGAGPGQQNKAYVAGITGVTVASSAPVAVDSSGQLSSLGTGSSGQVLTSTGTTSPTWQTPPSSPAATSDALVALNSTVSNVTGDGTFYGPIIFDTELFDVGSNYNPATGLFTAPTTGKYLCCASITLSGLGSGHVAGEMRLLIDGGTFTRSSFNPYAVSASGLYTYTFSLPVAATASQTLSFGILAAGSTKTVGVQGNSFGYYSFASFTLLA